MNFGMIRGLDLLSRKYGCSYIFAKALGKRWISEEGGHQAVVVALHDNGQGDAHGPEDGLPMCLQGIPGGLLVLQSRGSGRLVGVSNLLTGVGILLIAGCGPQGRGVFLFQNRTHFFTNQNLVVLYINET